MTMSGRCVVTAGSFIVVVVVVGTALTGVNCWRRRMLLLWRSTAMSQTRSRRGFFFRCRSHTSSRRVRIGEATVRNNFHGSLLLLWWLRQRRILTTKVAILAVVRIMPKVRPAKVAGTTGTTWVRRRRRRRRCAATLSRGTGTNALASSTVRWVCLYCWFSQCFQ